MYKKTDAGGLAGFDVVPGAPLKHEVDYHGAKYKTQTSTSHAQEIVQTKPFGLKLIDSYGQDIENPEVHAQEGDEKEEVERPLLGLFTRHLRDHDRAAHGLYGEGAFGYSCQQRGNCLWRIDCLIPDCRTLRNGEALAHRKRQDAPVAVSILALILTADSRTRPPRLSLPQTDDSGQGTCAIFFCWISLT